MVDVEERRRKNLSRILEGRFEGNQAALARAIDRTPTMVWKMFTDGEHKKPIGEKLARHIERQLQLQHGWLDGVAQVVLPEVLGAHDIMVAGDRRAYATTLLRVGGVLRWALGRSADA